MLIWHTLALGHGLCKPWRCDAEIGHLPKQEMREELDMRNIKPLLATVFLITAPAVALSASEDDVNAAYQSWNAAFNSGDAGKVGATYTDDAVFLPPTHDVIEGPEKIQEFFNGLFEAGVTEHNLEVIRVMDSGDQIIAAARWSAKGGDGADIGGIATHVFQKQEDGSLKLMLHTFN
ncbi:nuclear transport factor 2 family protein [Aurantimonas sp. A2-1-M11]